MFVTLLHIRFLLLLLIIRKDNTGIEPASPAPIASVVTIPLIATTPHSQLFSLWKWWESNPPQIACKAFSSALRHTPPNKNRLCTRPGPTVLFIPALLRFPSDICFCFPPRIRTSVFWPKTRRPAARREENIVAISRLELPTGSYPIWLMRPALHLHCNIVAGAGLEPAISGL